MDARKALTIAKERGLDLIEVSPNAVPPVCKIMDYGKFKYEMNKKQKKPRTQETKQIRLNSDIDEHDVQFKVRNANKFLASGDKVKFSVLFRSREITHPELGERLLQRIADEIEGVVEKTPTMEGRLMIMIVSPK